MDRESKIEKCRVRDLSRHRNIDRHRERDVYKESTPLHITNTILLILT